MAQTCTEVAFLMHTLFLSKILSLAPIITLNVSFSDADDGILTCDFSRTYSLCQAFGV